MLLQVLDFGSVMDDGLTDYDLNEMDVDQEFLKLINKLLIIIALTCVEQHADEETENFFVFFLHFFFCRYS